MYQRNFYMPFNSMGMRSMGFAPTMNMGMQKVGLFSKIRNTFKGMNFGGLLTSANKALGVVNQAIPIVKQAGPMFNNMRSMVKLASVFKDETDPLERKKVNRNENENNMNNNYNQPNYNNSPNFFL